MNFEQYKGKKAVIRSTGVEGIIENVINKRGADNSLGARYVVVDGSGNLHELMPHEINIINPISPKSDYTFFGLNSRLLISCKKIGNIHQNTELL